MSLSYTLCNQYEENRFKYQDAEDLLQAVMQREKHEKSAKKYAEVISKKNNRQKRAASIDNIQEEEEEVEVDADPHDARFTMAPGKRTS